MKLLLLSIAFFSMELRADERFINNGGVFSIGAEPQMSTEQLKTIVNNVTTQLSKVNALKADCKYCEDVNINNRPTPKCIETYSQLYARPTVEMRVVLGYSDASANPQRIGPHDLLVKEQMVNLLTKDCAVKPSGSFFLCGFARSADDADLFTKNVKAPNGEVKIVNLVITNSSVSTDDNQNQGKLLEQQLIQTERARKTYLDGLRTADVVLYNGHSRKGGGPDFAPAKRLENTHIDYAFYQKDKPGLTDLVEALKERIASGKDTGPSLIGFFSCGSEEHFSKSVAAASPNSGFIGTLNPPSWADSHRGVLTVLNAMLGKICNKSLVSSLDQNMDIRNNYIIERFWK
ncbi:MAG: hypothetical protein H7336_07385 [Bacteriovorax sp.]|nr:hypothetical protein [Bacteriovorax sp.]